MKNRYLFLGLTMMVCMAGSFAQGIGGTTGTLTWSLENGILTISGNGAMPDYVSSPNGENASPWYNYHVNTVIIENGVTSIGECAFHNNFRLFSISIPNSVTKIGEAAFTLCTHLGSIDIPDSVTFIGNGAFGGCSYLTSATFPNGAIDFGLYVFHRCTKLTSITNLNPIPQLVSWEVFGDMNRGACTLYVPVNSVSAYKIAEVWKDFIIVGVNVGIEDIEVPMHTLIIYPNPTTGTCNITIPEEFLYESSLTLSVYNDIGVLVQQIQINNKNEYLDLKLDQKAKGVYMVKLSNGKKIYTGKIVFE